MHRTNYCKSVCLLTRVKCIKTLIDSLHLPARPAFAPRLPRHLFVPFPAVVVEFACWVCRMVACGSRRLGCFGHALPRRSRSARKYCHTSALSVATGHYKKRIRPFCGGMEALPSCRGECMAVGDDFTYGHVDGAQCRERCLPVPCRDYDVCGKRVPQWLLDAHHGRCLGCEIALRSAYAARVRY